MIEIPTVLFSLLIEGFIALLVILIVLLVVNMKRNKKDIAAARKLVEQIRHQSQTRQEDVGSFLVEKYRLEGDELEKSIKLIDKAEKKFMQKLINVYLKRDSLGLASMDASVAELIETYKDLSPVIPEIEELAGAASEATAEQQAELENLKQVNEQLIEELAITKKTMGNMIAEFGNMFGGGKENRMESEEVLEKVSAPIDEFLSEEIAEQSEIDGQEVSVEQDLADPDIVDQKTPEQQESISQGVISQEEIDAMAEAVTEEVLQSQEAAPSAQEEAMQDSDSEKESAKGKEQQKKNTPETSDMLDFDEGIEELMGGIDLSDDSL